MERDLSIPDEFKKNGYMFKLHIQEDLNQGKGEERKMVKAIYIGDGKNHSNIEVVVLREGHHHPMSGIEGTKMHYPSTEQWGIRGWTYRTIEGAEKKFQEI